MHARDAIKICLDMAQLVCLGYVEDLTDEQLMRRPHPDCNHINWQLGHLISGERYMVEAVAPGSMPALPEGFEAKYTTETAKSNDPKAFCTKDELLTAYRGQRAATLAALAKVSDEDLGKPAPESMQSYAPTVAAVYEMQGSHYLMHAGQWVVVRRQLGKPPLY